MYKLFIEYENVMFIYEIQKCVCMCLGMWVYGFKFGCCVHLEPCVRHFSLLTKILEFSLLLLFIYTKRPYNVLLLS